MIKTVVTLAGCSLVLACVPKSPPQEPVAKGDSKVVSVINHRTEVPAADLHLTFTGTGGSVTADNVLVQPGDCPQPTIPSNPPKVGNTVDIEWGVPCVAPGATVTVHVSTHPGPLQYYEGFWTAPDGSRIAPVPPEDVRLGD